MKIICSKISYLVANVRSLKTGSGKEAVQRIFSTRKQRGHFKLIHQVVLKHLKKVCQTTAEMGYP